MKMSARIPNLYCSLTIVLLVLMLPFVSLAQGDSDCCVGRVGDANGFGGDEPTIGDITAIINAKFISPLHCEDWLACVQEADINQSGGLNPTCEDITIGDIAILIDYLFITGQSLGLPNCLEPSSEPTGYLVSNTGCKSFEGDGADLHGNTQSCLQYDYDGTGTLSLTHLNAAFNCCPDYITAVFSFIGNTITITEGENLNSGGCDCICLYDLQFQIDNLPPGEYHIIVEELYVQGEDIPLDFVVDLSQAVSDEYCVDRTHYPWGTEGTSGYLIGYTGCKSFDGAALSDQIPNDQDCLEYSYDEDGTLTFVHVNAGFNCCPTSLLVDFSFDGNTITITESENLENGGCYCLCLFDLSYVITNLSPDVYHIVVVEPYVEPGEQPLDFVLNLLNPTSGTYCVPRSNYPWGTGDISGHVVEYTGCKSFDGAALSDPIPNDQGCMVWTYDGDGILSFNHVNAGFNCCPSELGADFSFEGNTITISEYELLDQGGCRCLCLFDLEYFIANLPPGVYHIVVNEPYAEYSGDPFDPLDFVIDLTAAGSGTFCVDRIGYPWGDI